VQVSQALPGLFTNLDDLYDLVTEHLRYLPTIVFGILLSTSKLPRSIQIGLSADLLLPFTSAELPTYTSASPSQDHLETFFLPAASKTQSLSYSAKISLLLETMFANMLTSGALVATKSLRDAVEKGIAARSKVYGDSRRKKGSAHEEEQSKELMESSNNRLLALLEVLEVAAGKPPQPYKSSVQRSDLPQSSSFSSAISMSSPLSDLTDVPTSDLPDV
jgi:hypothetical protein